MNGKLSSSIFWASIGVFIVAASIFTVPALWELFMSLLFVIVSVVVFFLLSGALIFSAVKEKVPGILKKFYILTGASSVGFFVSLLLHYVIYGLFIQWFGVDFWGGNGLSNEPFFFIMAIFVCPAGFLVGAVGSIVVIIRRFKLTR